jgi:hypothetical protein
MSKLVLIESLTPNQANIIEESTTDGKNFYLSGIFMQADIKNRNSRVYPLSEIAAAVAAVNEKIKLGTPICGELNHPSDLQINLERVSHVITEMRMDGLNAIGKAKLLNTPTGNIAKALLEGGVRLGVSSRGTGAVNEGVVSDFQFVTVDIVSDPSAPSAYPDMVRESVENTKILTLAEAVVHDDTAQKYLQKEIQSFIKMVMRGR